MIEGPGRNRRSARDRGASLIEYALLLALIAVACFAAVAYLGNQTNGSVNHSKECIDYYTNRTGGPPATPC